MTDLLNDRHYMRLPICGYCMNAWDIIYKRPPWNNRPGVYTPEEWLNHCRVGGCDPEVWDFMEMQDPPTDNRVFHRRSSDSDSAPWRKNMPRLVAAFAERRNRHYAEKVVDKKTGLVTRVVPDDEIDFGFEEEDEEPVAAVVPDDDIEW